MAFGAVFGEFDDREVLKDVGKITAAIAKDHAECEFEKFRITQDQSFISDFDEDLERQMKAIEKKN